MECNITQWPCRTQLHLVRRHPDCLAVGNLAYHCLGKQYYVIRNYTIITT